MNLHLPCSRAGAAQVLAIGAGPTLVARLVTAGYRVETHRLDLGPAAALAGEPFTPPVTAWPHETAAYDVVILLDELALVVDDEAAIGEAARVLRPGGTLILRIPNAGLLAWLDAYNLYRYVRDATGAGSSCPKRGVSAGGATTAGAISPSCSASSFASARSPVAASASPR